MAFIIQEIIAVAVLLSLDAVRKMVRHILLKIKRRYPVFYTWLYKSRYWLLGGSAALAIIFSFRGHLTHDPREVDDFIANLERAASQYDFGMKEESVSGEPEDQEEDGQLTDAEMEAIDEVLPQENLNITSQPSRGDLIAFDGEASKSFWLQKHDPMVKKKFQTDKAMVRSFARLLLWRNQYRPPYQYKDPPLQWRLKKELEITTGIQIRGR